MKRLFSNSKYVFISPECNFLKTLASELLPVLKDAKDFFKIVFPHRRAGLYLRYYLGQERQLPLLLPQIYSIEDFVNEIFVKIDPRPQIPIWDLIYSIFNFVKDTKQFSKINTVDKFLPWGYYIVDAIDEIDMEMVDLRKLKEAHINILSPFVSEIADLLTDIYEYVDSIRKDPNFWFSTKGERYRVVANQIAELALDAQSIILAGFSFLTGAERKIFEYLINSGSTLILEGNPSDLKGIFSSKITDESVIEIKPKSLSPKKIEVYKSGNFHQTLVALREQNLLENKDKAPDRNLILLTDPSKLMAVVSFHPRDIPLNVTMGYPFLNTRLGMFLNEWFKLILTAKEESVLTLSLISWLNHNYFSAVTNTSFKPSDESDLIRDLDKILREYAPKYVSKELILKILNRSELKDQNKISGFVTWLFDVALVPYISSQSVSIMPSIIVKKIKEFLDGIFESIDRKKSEHLGKFLVSQIDYVSYSYFLNEIFWPIYNGRFGKAQFNSTYSVFNFLSELISSLRIPISTKPLVGNQTMGLLETRLLAFDRVIVLEANEGLLPTVKSANPLFPEPLRRVFANKRETEEMIQRHHLLRLIGASQDVYIYYSDPKNKEDGKKGAKSRFLEEIQWEALKNNKFHVIERPLSTQKPVISKPRQGIAKDECIKGAIKNWISTTPISASIINTYLRCQIRFFYKYILKLEEPDELSETFLRDFGSIVHSVLDQFLSRYKNCENLRPNDKDRDLLMEILDQTLSNSDLKIQLDPVRYRMLQKVAEYRLSDFFQILKEKCEHFLVTILDTESEFRDVIFPSQRTNITIRLGGRYDCIMKINDEHWILDFKTGGSKSIWDLVNLQRFFEWSFDTTEDKDRLYESFAELSDIVKDFQVLFYVYTYTRAIKACHVNASYIYLAATKEKMEQVLFRDDMKRDFRDMVIERRIPEALELILLHLLNYDYLDRPVDTSICKSCGICG